MPTGYTAYLDDEELDTATWFKQNLSRAFGICVHFRDSGDMTEDEMKQRVKEIAEEESWHKKRLSESKDRLKTYKSYTDDDWLRKMELVNNEREEYNIESREKANRIKNLHDRARKDLQKILDDEQADEVSKNIAEFGIDQLNLCKSEEEPYIDELITDVEQFKKDTINETKRSIQYHTRELKEEIERESERYEAYIKVCEDADRILGE